MSRYNMDRIQNDSIAKERKRVKAKRKKMVNYVSILVLIASLSANMVLINDANLIKPSTFNKISYGEDYEKEFEDVNSLIEKCISGCIRSKINDDTSRVRDGNGIDQGIYYYNFNNYDKVFSNLEITINKYQMSPTDAKEFADFISNLSEVERQAILVYYGTDFVKGDEAKESFRRQIGGKLIENNFDEKMIEALAKNSVHDITDNFLNNHWVDNTLGRGGL